MITSGSICLAVFLFFLTPAVGVGQENSSSAEFSNLKKVDIQEELTSLKQEVARINFRIQRLGLWVDLEKAKDAQDDILNQWRSIRDNRDSVENFAEEEAKVRQQYYKIRSDVLSISEKIISLRE